MTGPLHIAWQFLRRHPGRSLLLVACISLTALLPLAVGFLVSQYTRALNARAAATPMLVGAEGSRYDLVLNSLYFTGRVPRALPAGRGKALRAGAGTRVVPLLIRHEAEGRPLVGTTLDYFMERGLVPQRGRLLATWGECVLGSEAAAHAGVGPGDTVLTSRGSLYDMGLTYPLRLRVVGVLRETGSPDDRAVFTDLNSVWILEGHGHGHKAADEVAPDAVLKKDGDEVVLSPKTVEFTEITPENIDSFHFHQPRDELPVTAFLVYPPDAKRATILSAQAEHDDQWQILEPTAVVEELLGFVLTLKTFFDANTWMVGIATALFLVLVVWLSIRSRQGELETLARIGVSRSAIAQVLVLEFLFVIGAAAVVAGLGAFAVLDLLRGLLPAA